jgi:hypothetical protein
MDYMDLIKESQKIKRQADKILKESGIVDMLSDYGQVKIAGSHALDLMLRPDIDLFVVADEHNWDKALEINSGILKKKYFRDVYFINWLDFENKKTGNTEEWIPDIRGYYFAAVKPFEGERWKLDIWLITPEYDKSRERTEHYKKLLEVATYTDRLTILEIKNAMREGKKYVKGVDGKLIYQAVLEKGIKSVEDFKKLLGK